MEITTTIHEYIDSLVPAGDFQQDLFVHLLEIDAPEFETKDDCEKWINIVIKNLKGNTLHKEYNRAKLMEENEDFIRDIYGYNNQAEDPMEILQAEELETELLGSLTELEKDIYGMVIAANLCTYKEAAEVLHITDGALRQHITRIRRKFNGKATRSEAPHEEVHS